MSKLWDKQIKCELLVLGYQFTQSKDTWIIEFLNKEENKKSIINFPFLSRNNLLQAYCQASALLIPLFNDEQSKARFPTKIGEYLASGTPVITSAVGDIPLFFIDNFNGYICQPGNEEQFADKIKYILQNPLQSNDIGSRGRKMATENFQYSLYSNQLNLFFNGVEDVYRKNFN
jgi:glycosyltransferase involved in cell wall biosynthesis